MKKDFLVYLFFSALSLIFFFPFLTGNDIFGFRDLSLYFYPLRHLMVEMVKSGQLPLWNPYIYCGIPFLATLQSGFLYPFSILFYILPFNLGFNWFIILHYFLAAVFTYHLAKHYGIERAGAVASGIIFAFSGYLLSVSNMNTTLTSVIWLPLVILWWDRLLGIRGKEREEEGGGGIKKILTTPYSSLISLIILLSLMFLGGEPTIFYSTVIILIIYAFFQNKIGRILYLIPVLLLTLGLLAVQIFPFIEYAVNSVRMWRTEYDFISHSSFPLKETINFAFPQIWGNFLAGTYVKELLGGSLQTWILSSYIGLLPLFLAGLAFIKTNRTKVFYAVTAVFFLFLAFGHYTPCYKLFFYALPGLSLIRYPVKFLFFPTLAVAVLAGWGINELEGEVRPRVLAAFCGVGGLVFGIAVALGMFKKSLHGLISARLGLAEYYKYVLGKLLSVAQLNLFYVFMILSLAMILLFLFYRKMVSGRILVYGLVILIAADLFIFNGGLNPPVSSKVYSFEPSNVKWLLSDRSLFRFYVDPEIYEKSGAFFTGQNEILFSLKSKLAPNLIIPQHLSDFNGRESVEPQRNVRFYWAIRDQLLLKRLELLSRANVKYILSYKKLNHPRLRLINAEDGYLYRNLGCYPRAYLKGGNCRILKYESQRVEILADSASGGKLILADNYYPGWKAALDGKPIEIKREQYLFRGVAVPAGRHKVVFRYEPDSVKYGAIFSLVSLISLVGLVIWNLRLNAAVKK